MPLSAQESLDLALDYIALGPTRYLFPIKAGAKFPPLIKNNLNDASNDPAQIRKWAKKWPGCNWGLAHKKSNVLVADIDTKPGKEGQLTYDMLDIEYGWPETEETLSPSGGRHLIYEGPHVFALGENGFGKDIDSPNYTILPGCVTSQGAYEMVRAGPTAAAPQWMYDRIGAAKVRIANVEEAAVELDKPANVAWTIDFLKNDAEPAIEGKNGDFQTLKIAMGVRDKGISPEKTFELMLEFYNPRCVPPWEPDDLQRKVTNAFEYASQSQAGGKTAEAEFGEDELTDADIEAIEIEATPAKLEADRQERQRAKDRERNTPVDQRQRFLSLQTILDEWVWVADVDRFVKIDAPNIMWRRASFDAHYKYAAPKGSSKLSENLFGKTQGSIRRFETMGYVPGEGISLDGGRRCNLYRPSKVIPKPGDTTFWDAHLAFLFPNEYERTLLLNWLAWFYQNLKRKPKHALLIQGREQGTGKSFIVDMLCRIIGDHNATAVSQTDLSGNFNGYAMRTKLIVIEELRAVERMSIKTALHDIITQDKISINEKNMPKFEMDNYFGIIGMTNDDAAISLDVSDRRYLVIRTNAKPRDVKYYVSLYAKLNDPDAVAAVAYMLQNWDVGEYDGAGRAPYTSAKEEMIQSGLSELETFLIENAQTYPLNGRVTTVNDVMAMLPARLERHSRLSSALCAALKTHFKAELAGQFRIENGTRPRLYVINGNGLMNFDGWQERIAGYYDGDRKKAEANEPIGDDGNELLTDDDESTKE